MASESESSDDDISVMEKRPKFQVSRRGRRFSFGLYEAVYGPVVFVRAVYRQLILLGVMFVSGALVFNIYEHLQLLDAFLASVSTITTIGLYVPNGGNFSTMNKTEAVLLIFLIIFSVGAGASILQNTVNTVVNGELTRAATAKKLIERLKGHVIVVGYSHLGRYVVQKLEELGIDCVIATRDKATYDELLEKDKLVVLENDNRALEVLGTANISKAALVIVAHADDPNNMLYILSARKLRPDIRIVSVVHSDALVEAARTAGANHVIPSDVTVGHLLALSAVTEDLVGIVFSEKVGTKEIAEFSVFRGSPLIGQGLRAISETATLIGVVREGEVVRDLFDPSFRVEEDDTLLVFGDPAKLQILEEESGAN